MAFPSSEIGVTFDPAALEAGMQRIVAERLQSRAAASGTSIVPCSPRVAHSSHSSITVFDDSGGGGTLCAPLSGITRYFTEDVETRYTDLLLLICTFASGTLDSAAFNAWGSFANMQTGSYTRPLVMSYAQLTSPHPVGNVIFLALGASGQPPQPSNRWVEALVAIITFMIGNLFFVNACRFLGPLRRSTLIASFALQTTAVIVSSILVQTGTVDADIGPKAFHGSHWLQLIPISLLAFQAAGQIVTSRLVGVDELPTLVLTTVLCDLLIDRNLLAGLKENPVRNRRAAMFFALFLGAMISGFLAREAGLACPLWIAAGLKGSVTLCWVFWRGAQPKAPTEKM